MVHVYVKSMLFALFKITWRVLWILDFGFGATVELLSTASVSSMSCLKPDLGMTKGMLVITCPDELQNFDRIKC